jgi:ABC-type glycerol-3-phosphate transport system substrate-binding protein
MQRLISSSMLILVALSVISCTQGSLPFGVWFGGNNTAVLWSDQPEFAFYANYFNASQNQYKVETYYFDSPAQWLQSSKISGAANPIKGAEQPDIVAGNWLKSVSIRTFFKPLDKHFKTNALAQNAFYPRLLDLGNIDGNQYLLPVSFNVPMVIFDRERENLLSSPFIIGFNEMKELGKNYNTENRNAYTRMGFSPIWDDNFLFITASLFNASFREAEPLAWDSSALDRAMTFAYEWTCEANSSIQAVDDFIFKYLYDPPTKLILSGRILFSCMDSDGFFTLSQDEQNNLDFRWLAEQNIIPLAEKSTYLGLARKGKAPKAAEAFLRWFFNVDTQRRLLEMSHQYRMFETSFGISGGFSAMRPVTEQVFPQFYRSLLGHMPPPELLSPANILPSNWMILKERVILPYLRDRVRHPDQEDIYRLEDRLADWLRVNQ